MSLEVIDQPADSRALSINASCQLLRFIKRPGGLSDERRELNRIALPAHHRLENLSSNFEQYLIIGSGVLLTQR